MHIYERLLHSDLFRGLDTFTVRRLLEEISYRYQLFQKNDFIIHEGESIGGQYILLNGTVRTEMLNHAGKIIKIEDIESGQLLAPAFLHGKKSVYPVSVIANQKSEIIFFIKRSFTRLLQMNETVLINYLAIISGRAQYLSEKLRLLAFHTIKGKIAYYLTELSKKQKNETLTLTCSQTELADYFGVTRPSLGRVMRELQEENIIHKEGKCISILDHKKLREFIP